MLFLEFARAVVTREPSVSAGQRGGKPRKYQRSYVAEVAPE
ncbi:hypothetical protein [Mesorhizobium sp. J428]|nr:hypothetical protein [Mesorhizobium sp. J428]